MSALPTQPAHGLPVALPFPLPFPDGRPTPFDAYGLLVWLLAPGPPGTSFLVVGCGGRVVGDVVLAAALEFACAARVVGGDVVAVGVGAALFLPTLLTRPLAAPFGSALPEANAAEGSSINPTATHSADAPASRLLYPFVVTLTSPWSLPEEDGMLVVLPL